MVDPTEAAAPEPCGDESGVDGDAMVQCMLDMQRLVTDCYESVYRYAFRLTGRAQDAEDLSQQTFLVAQRKLHQVREAEKVSHWLFAILRSCFLKSRRRRRPVAAAGLGLNVDELPEQMVQQVEREGIDEERLQRALDEVPDEFRLVLVMFYFEDLSYKEIAAELEIPIGTVMSRLSRAKARLRQRLIELSSEEHSPEYGGRNRSRMATW